MKKHKQLFAGILLSALIALCVAAPTTHAGTLDSVLTGQQRSTEHKRLDQARQPQETLDFFRVQPNRKVIEIWPGDGWFTEILAPYLKDDGLLITAVEPGNTPERNARRSSFVNKLADDSDNFGDTVLVTFEPPKSDIRPVGGVDVVLTDGNVQTWVKEGTVDGAFAAFYRALKSGGVLGVINRPEQGVPQDTIVAKAKAAGFILDAQKLIGTDSQLAFRFQKPADAPVPLDVVKAVSAD